MSKYEVRLGAKLLLDDAREMDLINIAEGLNSSRKMSGFITALFRTACDNLEKLSNGDKEKYEQLVQSMASLGVSEEREAYFRSLEEKVHDMQKKIDSIYDVAFKTYSLAQVNKMNGLSGKSENLALAQFALQKQMRDIEEILGANIGVYESGRLIDMKKKADSVLEFIIEAYDGVGEALGINSGNNSSAEYDEKIHKLEVQIEELSRNSGNDNDDKIEEFEKKIEELNIVNDRLDRQVKTLEEENSSLSIKIGGLEKENEELRDRLLNSYSDVDSEQYEEQIITLKKKLKQAVNEVEDLKDENELLERKIKRISGSNEAMKHIDNIVNEEKNTSEEEQIDFSKNADLGAISNFFGEK